MPSYCCELGSYAASCLYQPRDNIHHDRSDWNRHGCAAYSATNTDSLGTSDADEAEGRPHWNVWRRVYVSANALSLTSYCLCIADLRRTIVTSIVRLIILIPSLTSVDQNWVIAEGTLWM